MRQSTPSFVGGFAVVMLLATVSVHGPDRPAAFEAQDRQVEARPATVINLDGPPVPEDWPEHWPDPSYLDPAEIRAVESAPYLYSTWYGSPQVGLSPAAALAARRGAQFERFVQFGVQVYFVPRERPGQSSPGAHEILAQAIVDAAFHLCPEADWPGLGKLHPRARNFTTFANVIGPGDRVRGFSGPNPVHCYWSHMPRAEWEGSKLVPPPSFEEVWGTTAEGG